jgi:hypothetical protein
MWPLRAANFLPFLVSRKLRKFRKFPLATGSTR